MNYAIRTLEAEQRTLEKILSTWEDNHYPEAKKIRDKRLKEVTKAIEILKKNIFN